MPPCCGTAYDLAPCLPFRAPIPWLVVSRPRRAQDEHRAVVTFELTLRTDRTKQGPHRCGPAHFPMVSVLSLSHGLAGGGCHVRVPRHTDELRVDFPPHSRPTSLLAREENP